MFCVKCGNLLSDDAKFCNQCGAKIATMETFCINCGSKLEAGSSFCTECGTKIGDTVAQTNTTPSLSEKEIQSSYKKGKECYDRRLYEFAFKHFQTAAMQGHMEAQYKLAEMYESGFGVSESEKHAIKWYHIAAEQGHAASQYELAINYMDGNEDIGIEKDYETGLKWLTLSVEQGYADAICTLAKEYDYKKNNEEIDKKALLALDINKARELYEKAADKGNLEAKVRLAALDLRLQLEELDTTNSPKLLKSNIVGFFNKVIPLFAEKTLISQFYVCDISKKFEKKLKGALTYAKLQKDEIPLIVMDSTVFGNAKEGLLFTTWAFHIKNYISKPEIILLDDIHSVLCKKKSDYYRLTINGNETMFSIQKLEDSFLLRYILISLIETFQYLHDKNR